ncbi:ROK family transcriptional regulator [Leifsonia poae]|uniref:ROK family transcriptional regulator n=1 Tax=Leifsonia poae TaxID=110933 RepID=UPI001CBB03DD|nr:ROK family transcriptional regulator [Leifsonia poae]
MGDSATGELAGMRRRNLQRIVEAVRETPGLSQSDLAASTGLAVGAVSSLVNALIDAGVVSEESARSGRGRPRRLLRLDDRYADLVGVRITRGGIDARSATLSGRTLVGIRRPAIGPWSIADAAATMLELVTRVTEGLRRPGAHPSIVISFPGVSADGLLSTSEFDWIDEQEAELLEPLRAAGFAQIVIRNDGGLATLGEWRVGAARGHDNAIVILLGRGLGGSAVVDGHLLRGHGSPLGFGHVPIDPAGPICVCGQRGCLEVFASLQSFAALLGESERFSAMASIDYAVELDRRAADGDAVVLEILASARRRLREFGELVAALFLPEVVVLSGQSAAVVPWLLSDSVGMAAVPMVRGVLDADAALVGAVLAAQELWMEDPISFGG